MGDVALTTPVLRGVLKANPDLEITLVSKKAFEPMFQGIDRLTFYGVDLNSYSGVFGLHRLYSKLSKLDSWDKIIDLHSVMRTWVLSFFFRASGHKVYTIDKGRAEKAELTAGHGKKELRPLEHTTHRYLDVFHEAGIQGEVQAGASITASKQAALNLDQFLVSNGLAKEHTWIGIAPFSKHAEKEWPLDRIKKLIDKLIENDNVRIVLLGGGESEIGKLKQIASTHRHVHNFAGVLSLEEEISLIHKLDCMVAMDSFNMHLAALCDIPVVSIWGATHPYAGFGPLNGNDKYIVQTPVWELDCRPCSIFGNRTCHRGDLACLERIQVDQVNSKIEEALTAS